MTTKTEPLVEQTPQQTRNRTGNPLPLVCEFQRMTEAAVAKFQELAKEEGDKLVTKAAEVQNAIRQYDAAMREEQTKVRAGLNTISGGGVELMARASKEGEIKHTLRRNGWRV
jgi:hypothetical protein